VISGQAKSKAQRQGEGIYVPEDSRFQSRRHTQSTIRYAKHLFTRWTFLI